MASGVLERHASIAGSSAGPARASGPGTDFAGEHGRGGARSCHPRFAASSLAIACAIIASSRWAAASCPPLSARSVATAAAGAPGRVRFSSWTHGYRPGDVAGHRPLRGGCRRASSRSSRRDHRPWLLAQEVLRPGSCRLTAFPRPGARVSRRLAPPAFGRSSTPRLPRRRRARLLSCRAMFLIGIDVGGTFTDLTAIDEATGRVVVTKVPSRRRPRRRPSSPASRALGIASRDVRRVVHGTTVGTNAVLERRGAPRRRPHHRGLPRPHRDRPHQAQYPGALRARPSCGRSPWSSASTASR